MHAFIISNNINTERNKYTYYRPFISIIVSACSPIKRDVIQIQLTSTRLINKP